MKYWKEITPKGVTGTTEYKAQESEPDGVDYWGVGDLRGFSKWVEVSKEEYDKHITIPNKAKAGQLSLLISTFNDIVISYADSANFGLTGVEALKNHIRENQIILFKAQLALKLIQPNAVISEVYTNAMISILAEMKTKLRPLYDSLAELLGIVEVIEPADLIAEWDKLHIAIHN